MPTEKTGNYQSSLKGGGVPPYWQNANIFPVFSYEGFPYWKMKIYQHWKYLCTEN